MDFKNITLLLEHLSIHNDKKIICPDCSCQFNTKDEMRSHYKKHLFGDGANIEIVQEDVKCQYCDNTYKTLTLLDRHENKRHKEELLMMLNVHLINPSKPIKNKETELENGESLELQEMTISVRDSRLKYGNV